MKIFRIVLLVLISSIVLLAQNSIYTPYLNDETESKLEDMGKMWTFDEVPVNHFEKEYGFKPSDEWLRDVQLSALQFASWCSASFVSEDGLIMTNHHCGRDGMRNHQREGEDLFKTGFYAKTIEEERTIPGFYVDQLVLMEDVTKEVHEAFNSKDTDAEKIEARTAKIKELEEKYSTDTDLVCKVVTLYNGAKFTLHGYKRFEDIRLVMAPEFQVASTGWDWDNFTYPRYELDFMFFRAYEDDKPVKINNWFNWSKSGADTKEPVFIIGRPGNTDRLLSVDELIFDKSNTTILLMIYNALYDINRKLYDKYPDQESRYLNRIMSLGNARKSLAGSVAGLDDYVVKRKRDFEAKLMSAVKANNKLSDKYDDLFTSIKTTIEELKNYYPEYWAYTLGNGWGPNYLKAAKQLVELNTQMKLDEEKRAKGYKNDELQGVLDKIKATQFDDELDMMLLEKHTEILARLLGKNHELYKLVYGDKSGKDAALHAVKNSMVASSVTMSKITLENLDTYITKGDAFINFYKWTNEQFPAIESGVVEAYATLKVLNQELGNMYADVYGNKIAPDATSTLRITDGRIKGYEYNGTLAPPYTTFYGMYDRYNSFGGKVYPWGLPEKWKTPPAELDLATPVGFASTNDIVGGNSGSAVINKNGEVVGIVHDGNMESLVGSSIYLPEKNRAVASDSRGIIESLKHVYKCDRLVKELENSKITE